MSKSEGGASRGGKFALRANSLMIVIYALRTNAAAYVQTRLESCEYYFSVLLLVYTFGSL